MQKNKEIKIDENLLNKIISVAYRDAELYDRLFVWFKAKRHPEIKNLFDEYRLTADSVHNIKQEEVTFKINERLHNKIKLQSGHKSLTSKLSYAFYSVFAKPVYAAASVTIILTAVIAFILLTQQAPKHSYTKAEIKLAQEQLEQSFAIIGKVFGEVETKLDKDVMTKHVSKPLNEGLNFLNDYLIGG